jgi:hypothetical protein
MNFNNESRFLNKEEIKAKVPSIFGYPSDTMSSKYVFTPTHEIIDSFAKVGWHPTRVSGAKPSSRDINTVKHLMRFSTTSDKRIKSPEGIIPEVIIVNSHNGGSLLSAHLGFFRLVCTNDLMAGTEISQMKWKHKKLDYSEVKEFILKTIVEFGKLTSVIPEYQKIILTPKQKLEFAEKTIQMVWNVAMFEPEVLLKPRRDIDNKDDLWTIFNILQENILKGGVQFSIPEDRMVRNKTRTTKAVKNIDKEINSNLLLWAMMDKYYKEGKF